MKVTMKLAAVKPALGCLRAAFATIDGENVDDHFGWAKTFVFYDVSKAGFVKAGKIVFDGEELDERGNDDKIAAKIDALNGTHLVYSAAIGGPAAARLIRSKIQPMTVREESGIIDICKRLQETLNGHAPPWLRKLSRSAEPERFDAFDDEDDD